MFGQGLLVPEDAPTCGPRTLAVPLLARTVLFDGNLSSFAVTPLIGRPFGRFPITDFGFGLNVGGEGVGVSGETIIAEAVIKATGKVTNVCIFRFWLYFDKRLVGSDRQI